MTAPAEPIMLKPGEGRHYDMGGLQAVFKADEPKTEGRFSISK